MSQKLLSLNKDLSKLQDEGYEIETKNGYALIHHIPYVNSNIEVKYGILVSKLCLAGDITIKPDSHTIHFIGEHPCRKDGTIITGIRLNSNQIDFGDGIVVNHEFSNKPIGRDFEGYIDYYEKFEQYIKIICAPAQAIDPSATPRTYNKIVSKEDSVFNYDDTNTSRAEIGSLSEKLKNHRIALIGVGGTGSYILDFIAKTPVLEIHLFDGDDMLQHNAYRTPGAPSKDQLRQIIRKTDYLAGIYSNMHKYIVSHPYHIIPENINQLLGMDFVFISIDKGSIKRVIIEFLVENKIPFIDVGIGIESEGNGLFGLIRTTFVTNEKKDHYQKRIIFMDDDEGEYSTNIQIAELNSLNAALAVIRWKKYLEFYNDPSNHFNTLFTLNTGAIANEDY